VAIKGYCGFDKYLIGKKSSEIWLSLGRFFAETFFYCLQLPWSDLFFLADWASENLNVSKDSAINVEVNFNFEEFYAAYWAH
jgi:hypothetical protein